MRLAWIAGLVVLITVTSHEAEAQTSERPPAFQRLVDCRAVTDPALRLACFDREVLSLQSAESNRELIVVDREQLKRTRRTLFGLTLPTLSIFEGREKEGEEVNSFETSIQSAFPRADGKWTLDLVEGGRWIQVDSRTLPIDPKAGHQIRIRKGALGSYLANVNNQVAIRVQRIR